LHCCTVISVKIKATVIVGNECSHAHGRILKKIRITQSLMEDVQNTTIRQILTYRGQSRFLMNETERVLLK